jgi:hypothetical protein
MVVLVEQLDETASELLLLESVFDLRGLFLVVKEGDGISRASSFLLLDVDVVLFHVGDHLLEELFDLVHLDSEWESSDSQCLASVVVGQDVGKLQGFSFLLSATSV